VVARQLTALAVANARYWLTVHRVVRRELERWRAHAQTLDGDRRAIALGKLADAGPHALITATLATLTPRPHRERATIAIVALEVMYDYLDAATEQGVDLHTGRELYAALAAPFASGEPADPYLGVLARACRSAVRSLPACDAISATAAEIAACCGEAQIRSHLAVHDPGQLASWAAARPAHGLLWWEAASGYAASILTIHALIAAAGDTRTDASDARSIADAYLVACALTTMLDSLLDREADAAAAAHSYISYYEQAEVSLRLGSLARSAMLAARRQRHGAHHSMTVAGIAAFYLSDPAAHDLADDTTAAVRASLRPTVEPALAVFRLWRYYCSAIRSS